MHAPGKTLSGAVLWRRGACVSSLLRHRRRGEAAAAEEPLSWGEKQPEVPRTFRRWHPRRRRVNYGILARRWETRLEDLHVLCGEAAAAPCPRATFPADAESGGTLSALPKRLGGTLTEMAEPGAAASL